MAPTTVTCFTLAYIGRNMKKSSCLKPKGLEPWYLVSPCGPLPSLFKLCPWGQNGPTRGSYCLHRLIWGKHWIFFVWNHKAQSLDIGYIASPSGPLPSLFKLCPWGQKWPARGNMFYIGLYREKHEIILSETTRPRALIFSMKHHLVNLYQVCSNYIPGAKNGPPTGVTFYIGL